MKTAEQIQGMIASLQEEVDTLPEVAFDGVSNKQELSNDVFWIQQLKLVLAGEPILATSEVGRWFDSKPSMLDEYEND